MNRQSFTLILLLLAFSFLTNCSIKYKNNYISKNTLSQGTLTDSVYSELSKILFESTNYKPKDTIIINYNYNNYNCWINLDKQNDSYINAVILGKGKRIRTKLSYSENTSVYRFKQVGNKFNKVILRDNSILTDEKSKLFNLLFNHEIKCGNSILIKPDKKFIYLKNDAHFELLNYK